MRLTRSRTPIIAAILLLSLGCAGNRPPNLSPSADLAYTDGRIVGVLDIARDVAEMRESPAEGRAGGVHERQRGAADEQRGEKRKLKARVRQRRGTHQQDQQRSHSEGI